jgi:hypothetical protein
VNARTYEETTMAPSTCIRREPDYQLRFHSLYQDGYGMAFPCDANGHVDLEGLPDPARRNYVRASSAIGREFAHPIVQAA